MKAETGGGTRPAFPLERFVVLDLARVRAGPTAAKLLGDWGADVIKIEPPAALGGSVSLVGDRDGFDFQNLHRNKRGITLNLKKPEGLDAFLRLAARADVVVENFRPEVKIRLGIDYAALKGVNPRIILASLSGYGQKGPYVKRPAFDQIIQGMAGLMSVTGLPGQGPVRAGIPIADLGTGLFGALGILVALLEREVSGEGQWVQTSLLEAQIALMDLQAARYLVAGEVPKSAGNHHPTGIPTGLFRTSDSHINIGIDGEDMWHRLCAAIDRPDLAADPDYADYGLRSRNRDALNGAIEAATKAKTTADWMEILVAADIPCGPVYDMAQVFDDPQVRATEMRHPVEHPRLGSIDLVSQPVTMSRGRTRKGAAAPDGGQHNDEVFRTFGFAAEEIAALRAKNVI